MTVRRARGWTRRGLLLAVIGVAPLAVAACGGARPGPTSPAAGDAGITVQARGAGGWVIPTAPAAPTAVAGSTAFATFFAPGGERDLVALALPSGRPRWHAGVAATAVAPVALATSAGAMVVEPEQVSGESEIVARRSLTGQVAWVSRLPAGQRPLTARECGTAYCVSSAVTDASAGSIRALAPATGAMTWSRPTPGADDLVAAAAGLVVAAPDGTPGALTAYSAETGRPSWSDSPPPGLQLAPASPTGPHVGTWYQDGDLLVGDLPGPEASSGGGGLVAEALRDGSRRWQLSGDHLAGPVTAGAGGAKVVPGSLVASTAGGTRLALLDAKGRFRWNVAGSAPDGLAWSADLMTFGIANASAPYRSAATGTPTAAPAVTWVPRPPTSAMPGYFAVGPDTTSTRLPATAPVWVGPAGAGRQIVDLGTALAGIPAAG